ncbi:odorant receptor 67c-like [Euwallacea fornicatus]|uniref:odorant receptor 67c-like n=1 Tax=Euwallacea fornicatus TaxID=995702 RepID=UPI00338D6D63
MSLSGQTQILSYHTRVLKYLLIWPLDFFNEKQNFYLTHGCFCYALFCSIPVFSGALYQFYVGIDNVTILLEALIGVGNITGYTIAYICFLKNQDKIRGLIEDFQGFIQYSGLELIQKTEKKATRHAKYLLSYATVGQIITYIWQMSSSETCLTQRGTQYYVRHDPCWLPVRNWYPFDASKSKTFWIIFPVEVLLGYHICMFFCLATATIIGLLMQISSQLKCCGQKFEHIFDKAHVETCTDLKQKYISLIKYYTHILEYAKRVFKVFNILIMVYISLTSFLMAVICYQIVNPNTSTQDRIKYAILLFAWCLLVYLICYNGQDVQDEAVKVGDAIFKSKWYRNGIDVKLKKYIIFTLARTQKKVIFKTDLFGSISLFQFMAVVKWAYSGLTLLLAVTDDE